MDNKLRRNEKCIIGLPRCDFVFASSRSCFIAYGFGTSALEMTVLRGLLEKRSIEAIEAGGNLASGQQAFCVKICSKVITSQFCIVLLNSDTKNGQEIPNANVNMEYGLMLGFNKYVIPFQRSEQSLPFNVASLDTVKYTNQNFESLAATAIDSAIKATTPNVTAPVDLDQKIHSYVLSRDVTYARINTEGDQAIFDLGGSLAFHLLIDFTGARYIFLGNFTVLRTETIIWRVRMLCRAIDARRSSIPLRIKMGLVSKENAKMLDRLFAEFEIWLIVNSNAQRQAIQEAIKASPPAYQVEAISLPDVDNALESIPS